MGVAVRTGFLLQFLGNAELRSTIQAATNKSEIMPWPPSDAVPVGEGANELSVTTRGHRLHFVVNGVEVANLTHSSLPAEGGVGVFVSGDLNEVNLEWLIVETPGPLVAH